MAVGKTDYPNPLTIKKYTYIKNTPTWKVRGLYLFGIISWLLVVYGFSGMFFIDPFFRWFVAPIITLFTLYHLLSFGFNLFYKKFDLGKHLALVKNYWASKHYPAVDIFLPICGEDIKVLDNTWKHVSCLIYPNKKIYILDDSSENCIQNRALALSYGFQYIERPNKGEMKKAGNLKYAFERTSGDYIAIFDADFAPHPNFLIETVPYMISDNVGIVQTPQYFDTSEEVYRRTPLAYAAAYQEEFFYRIIQVAKDRLDAAICCGSNALYKRKALEDIGGPRQVTASEDSRTGFALLNKGWVTRYIPVILAIGICPDNLYAYYHQQHRWARGRSELVLSKEFRQSSVSMVKKLANMSGFMSFLLRPLEILLSLQVFWVLFIYNDVISLDNAFIFYLYLVFTFVLIPLLHITRFRKEVFFASIIQAYASSHSVISVLRGRTVGWIATNAKHTVVSPAFKQTRRSAGVFVGLYSSLVVLAVWTGDIHVFDYNYWSVQFWIFFNLTLVSILYWQMSKVSRKMIKEKNSSN